MLHKFLTLLLGCSLFAGVAVAQETLTITKKSCEDLVLYQEGGDVAYKPEVEAEKGVVPADLNPSPLNDYGKPHTELPLKTKVKTDSYQLNPPNPAPGLTLNLNTETDVDLVLKNNRIYYKGEPISDDSQYEIARKCQEILKEEPTE